MNTDPPKPRLSPQGLQRGTAKSRDSSRDGHGGAAVGEGGGASQPRSSHKTRLAIATFLTSEGLVEAIEDLERAGFGRDQVSILGLEKALDALHSIASSKPGCLLGDLLALVAKSELSLMYTGDDFVLVACGPLWQKIGGIAGSGSEDGRIVVGSWMDPATRTELTRLISAGAIVLSVNADTVDQQRRSARILLSHSSHHVQTHEFTHN